MSSAHIIILAIAQAGFGFGLGMWFQATRKIREIARRDEAARFEPGDTVTFGDGSAIVIRTLPPPTKQKGDSA